MVAVEKAELCVVKLKMYMICEVSRCNRRNSTGVTQYSPVTKKSSRQISKMFAIQLVDVEEVAVDSNVCWLLSFTDVLSIDDTDVVDGWSWCGQP